MGSKLIIISLNCSSQEALPDFLPARLLAVCSLRRLPSGRRRRRRRRRAPGISRSPASSPRSLFAARRRGEPRRQRGALQVSPRPPPLPSSASPNTLPSILGSRGSRGSIGNLQKYIGGGSSSPGFPSRATILSASPLWRPPPPPQFVAATPPAP